jgi:hypothetical protein
LLWRGAWTYANRGGMCINVMTLYQTDDGEWRGKIYIQTDTRSREEDVSGHLIVLRPGAEAGMPSANVDPRAPGSRKNSCRAWPSTKSQRHKTRWLRMFASGSGSAGSLPAATMQKFTPPCCRGRRRVEIRNPPKNNFSAN